MTIHKAQDGETITITLEGSLDTVSAPGFQEALIPLFDEFKEVKLNFEGVDYVSSAGLRVLLMGQKIAKSKDASMIVSDVSDEVMEVFDLTGFSDMLTFA